MPRRLTRFSPFQTSSSLEHFPPLPSSSSKPFSAQPRVFDLGMANQGNGATTNSKCNNNNDNRNDWKSRERSLETWLTWSKWLLYTNTILTEIIAFVHFYGESALESNYNRAHPSSPLPHSNHVHLVIFLTLNLVLILVVWMHFLFPTKQMAWLIVLYACLLMLYRLQFSFKHNILVNVPDVLTIQFALTWLVAFVSLEKLELLIHPEGCGANGPRMHVSYIKTQSTSSDSRMSLNDRSSTVIMIAPDNTDSSTLPTMTTTTTTTKTSATATDSGKGASNSTREAATTAHNP